MFLRYYNSLKTLAYVNANKTTVISSAAKDWQVVCCAQVASSVAYFSHKK